MKNEHFNTSLRKNEEIEIKNGWQKNQLDREFWVELDLKFQDKSGDRNITHLNLRTVYFRFVKLVLFQAICTPSGRSHKLEWTIISTSYNNFKYIFLFTICQGVHITYFTWIPARYVFQIHLKVWCSDFARK